MARPGSFPRVLAACFLLHLLTACSMRCYKPYDVSQGETASSIARKFGISEIDLRIDNRVGAEYDLKSGDRIFLPCEAEERHRPPQKDTPQKASPKPQAPAAGPKTAAAPKPHSQEAPQKPEPPPKPLSIKLAWPLQGEILRPFTEGSDAPSNGIDIKTKTPAAVAAAAAGRVEYAGTPANAYGPMVLLSHGDGVYTVYSHMGKLEAATGQEVQKGQKIGTALADSYLHFEIRQGRKPLNPLLHLPRR